MAYRTESPVGRIPTKSTCRRSDSGRGLRATDRALGLTSAMGRRCSRRLGRNRLFFIARHRANHAIGCFAAQIGASSANATKMACCKCDTSVLQSLAGRRDHPCNAATCVKAYERAPATPPNDSPNCACEWSLFDNRCRCRHLRMARWAWTIIFPPGEITTAGKT